MGGLILADAAKQSMAKQAGSRTRVLLEILLIAFFVQSALATSSWDEQLFRNADKGNLPAVVWDVARGADVNAHVSHSVKRRFTWPACETKRTQGSLANSGANPKAEIK